MAQQQQSNMIKPQKIGQVKINQKGLNMPSMESQGYMKGQTHTPKKEKTPKKSPSKPVKMTPKKKQPSMSQVEKSVRKTMGY